MKFFNLIQTYFSKVPRSFRIGAIVLTILFVFYQLYSLFQIAEFYWKENDKRMYKLEISSFQKTDSEQLAMLGSSFDTKVKATLNMRVLEVGEKSVKVAFQFYPFEMSVGGERQTVLETLCMNPFLGEMTLDGRVIRWILPYTIAEKDENLILQNILLFHPVISGNRKKWVNRELDNLGEFIAKYNYKSGKVLKSKIKYTKVFVEDSDESETQEFSSNIQISYSEFTLNEGSSWIKNGSVKEKFELSGTLFEIDASKEGFIHEIPFQPDSRVTIWQDPLSFEDIYANLTKEPKRKLSIWEEARQRKMEEEFKGKDFITVYNQIQLNPNKFTDLPKLEKLRDYLEAFPEEALKIPNLIKSGKIQGHQIMEVLYILAKLGHKEAQNSLLEISKDSTQDHHARMQAIGGFHEVKQPLENVAPTLWEIYKQRSGDKEKDFSNTAILALGSISGRTKHIIVEGESQSEKIKKDLLKELNNSAKDGDRTSLLLSAIGNTADSRLLPKIQDKMNAEDKMVRAAFFDALSNFHSKEAKDILKDRLDKEESFEARNKIIQGLLQKTGDGETSNRVHESVLKEHDATNRFYMIKYLNQNKQFVSDYESKMKRLLEKEENPTNRELLYKGIYQP